MNLTEQIKAFIAEQQLLHAGQRALLAVSGGIDSVVLGHLFLRIGLDFGMAHCNFRLRGTESEEDELFVKSLAGEWNVPVFIQHFDTRRYAEENNLSIQMAARELRYTWFEVIREAQDFDCIATAHNLNDSVETALLNFIRGTGLTGLGGMPLRNGPVVRPLLFATRETIAAYAAEHGIVWREDSSNVLDEYTRNALRHHIIPEMLKINPGFLHSAGQTLEHLRAADQNLQYLLHTCLGQPDKDGVYRLDKHQLEQLPVLYDALFELLQPFGFTPDQVRQVVTGWRHTGAEWSATTGYRLVVDRQQLLLTNKALPEVHIRINAEDLMVRLPDDSQIFLMPAEPGTPFPEENNTVLVDADKLHFPLTLRRWRPGDVFQPLGMGGKRQKVQDFFTNKHLSRLDKERVWLLEDRNRTIVWLVGLRPDERFRIEKNTTKLLKICWITRE